MINLKLFRVIKDRGIENPNSYLVKAGFTHYTASRLLNNMVSGISFRHLEELCLLLQCTPNDILAWTAPSKKQVAPDHPLQKLIPVPPEESLQHQLENLSIDKMEEVKKFIRDLKDK